MQNIGVCLLSVLVIIIVLFHDNEILLLTGGILGLSYLTYTLLNFEKNINIIGGAQRKSQMVSIDKPVIYSELETDLVRIYENFTKPGKFDKTIPARMKKDYVAYQGLSQPLICYEIKDNKCIMDKDGNNIKDDRPGQMQQLFDNTIKYALENNLKIPNTTMHVYISDRFPFDNDDFVKFPIFLMAKPKNIDVPIIPDGTFEILHTEKKYKGTSMNWDEVKEQILEKNTDIARIKTIYFKGTDTTKTIHNIRKMLQDFSKNAEVPLEIHLDAWSSFENVWNFNKYTHVLNLPGHYPWSNRFKYLLLMDSVVINVDVRTESLDPKYSDEEYISFIDYVVKPNVHYVNIPYTYYRHSRSCTDHAMKEKVKKLQAGENKKLRDKIANIYEDSSNNPDKYEKMKQNAISTVRNLKMEDVYKYMYRAMCLNADLLDNY